MIVEQPVLTFLQFETSDDDGATWVEWTGELNLLDGSRGGRRSGASTTVEVGTISATLINAGDPIDDDRLKPNVRVRLRHRTTLNTVLSGRLVDLATEYRVNKETGEQTTVVTFSAADAVRSHAAITRYGAVTPGGVGYETWASRINRLSTSAQTTVNPPADDSPIVRYAI